MLRLILERLIQMSTTVSLLVGLHDTLVPHPVEEREEYAKNPKAYLEYRHGIETYVNKFQMVHWVGSEMNKAFSRATEESMARRLAKKPEIFQHLKPN